MSSPAGRRPFYRLCASWRIYAAHSTSGHPLTPAPSTIFDQREECRPDFRPLIPLVMPRVSSASSGDLSRSGDCSGCRKQNGTMQCIECIREGSGSAVFCAHGCFKAHWQSHRQGMLRQSSRYLSNAGTFVSNLRSCQPWPANLNSLLPGQEFVPVTSLGVTCPFSAVIVRVSILMLSEVIRL